SAAISYRVLRLLTTVDIPVDTGDFRLMSRRVVNALQRIQERHRFVRGLVAWLGFRQIGVPYERAARHAGESKYPVGKMRRFAADAIVSFSFAPMRWAMAVGLLTSMLAFIYAIYAALLRIIWNIGVQGWTSLVVAIMFIGGVQLIFLG